MKLSTMTCLFRTFDSDNESPVANQLLAPWSHDPGSFRFLRASANFVWAFKDGGKPCVLRANLEAERTGESFEREVNLMLRLSQKGFPAPKPILSGGGRYVERVETPQGAFWVLAYEAVMGRIHEPEELSNDQILEWGEALGRLHNAMEDIPAGGQRTWTDLCGFIEAHLPPEETKLSESYQRIRTRFEALPVRPGEFGVIQFDFESDNLVWTDQGIGVIDLDESCRLWYAADIAFALRSAFGDDPRKVNVSEPTADRFLEGYRRARPLSPEMVGEIPLFLAFHNVYMAARLIRSLSDGDQPGDPEWMLSLRQKLHAGVAKYRAQAV